VSTPGFRAEASLQPTSERYGVDRAFLVSADSGKILPQLGFGRYGGFGPTLPTCHYEKQWVVCGSPLPGYPAPMCLEWVYVCKFPGSSRTLY
jgi:hypothetical protein